MNPWISIVPAVITDSQNYVRQLLAGRALFAPQVTFPARTLMLYRFFQIRKACALPTLRADPSYKFARTLLGRAVRQSAVHALLLFVNACGKAALVEFAAHCPYSRFSGTTAAPSAMRASVGKHSEGQRIVLSMKVDSRVYGVHSTGLGWVSGVPDFDGSSNSQNYYAGCHSCRNQISRDHI